MSEYWGRIIDFFLADDTLRLGVVTGGSHERPALTDQNGRQHTIPARNIAVLHAERPAAGRISAQLEPVRLRVEELQSQVDTELLWESIHLDGKSFSADELAGLYFGESDCCRCSAMLRAVVADPLRFRRQGLRIHPRTAEQIEAQLLGERRRAEKEEARRRVRDWVAHILREGSEEGIEPPPDRENILRRIEAFLLRKQEDQEALSWLQNHDPDITPRMTAHDVLLAVGRLPASADPFLSAAGIDTRFSREAAELAAAMPCFAGDSRRRDYTRYPATTVDDEDTREVDDAFALVPAENGYRLLVHIADAAHFVGRDDPLDLEAQRRISTLYLPQITVRMLPDRVACEVASLIPGTERPSLTLEAELSPEGEIRSWELAPGRISITRRLSYEQADQLLADPASGDEAAMLAILKTLTDRLAAERHARGAIRIRRPELKVVVRNGQIQLKQLDPDSPSRALVTELMVLFNTLAAEHARRHQVPFVYRIQPRPADIPAMPEHYDPVLVNDLLSRLEKSRYSLEPGLHGGLGVDGYTQLTSPIRRYLDLVLQRQLKAHLEGGAPPYHEQELLAAIETVQSQEAELRATERKAVRFYCLSWLEQNRSDAELEVVVLKPAERGGYLVETDEYGIRGILETAALLPAGARLKARISRLNPQRNLLLFAPAT